MKIIFLILFINSAMANEGNWKLIGKTSDCREEIVIEAKEGNHNVRAYLNGERIILFPVGNHVFMSRSPMNLVFDSYNRKSEKQNSKRLIYTHHSTSGRHSGVIEIRDGQEKHTCIVHASTSRP